MTYNDGWSGQPSKSIDWGYQIGPGAFDIAAMQKLYGANTSYHAGSDTYTLPGKNVSGTGWFTLWDADGSDTIQVPTGAGSATIDLRAATLEEGDAGAGGYVSWVSGILWRLYHRERGRDRERGRRCRQRQAHRERGSQQADRWGRAGHPHRRRWRGYVHLRQPHRLGGWSEARHDHGLHARY